MTSPLKKTASIRLDEDIWNLIDAIGEHEKWTRNITIQEMAKYYAREKGISLTERKEEKND